MLTGMTEADWALVLKVFCACQSRRGDKGRDDRLFLEASDSRQFELLLDIGPDITPRAAMTDKGTADAPMGPRDQHSTVLTPAEEAIIVAFRQRTLLPLDDVMGCLREQIPKLMRSSLHRCLVRHGISRLPVDATMIKRGCFAETHAALPIRHRALSASQEAFYKKDS